MEVWTIKHDNTDYFPSIMTLAIFANKEDAESILTDMKNTYEWRTSRLYVEPAPVLESIKDARLAGGNDYRNFRVG